MITAEEANKKSNAAKDRIFLQNKECLLQRINNQIDRGLKYSDHLFDESVRSEDVIKLQKELEENGFEVKFTQALHCKLEVRWYDKE